MIFIASHMQAGSADGGADEAPYVFDRNAFFGKHAPELLAELVGQRLEPHAAGLLPGSLQVSATGDPICASKAGTNQGLSDRHGLVGVAAKGVQTLLQQADGIGVVDELSEGAHQTTLACRAPARL